MPTFTVHAPPPRNGETRSAPERFLFVRDGFHFWAFVLAPLWLLLRRLWLAFAIYVVGYALAGVGLAVLRAPATTQFLVWLLIALLIGFEAPSIWRWTLARRGWTMLGFVIGEDAEMAERRFSASGASAPQVLCPIRPLRQNQDIRRRCGAGRRRHPMSSVCSPSRERSGERCHRRLWLRQSAFGGQGV